ncbi:bifunctional 4-hydroxy-2-oxoglutarate aldolase/2-dehydro-3-deoxy-phosphogluconate aldolase [Cohnella candidum]|uniref:2-dehydro-3-deoxyphosphogluconate aldolase n=1 Tax=Cohnella candidum TaxID=2674991 RepID=A0A3G3K580_9BACL|nr:bifunctional 4-hydroxy-2-oxoglutarate aldolase/2-dehydro-3-deoxy-phosphogluconate aldolase [Cohnella candidum]AYQ74919.1 2-dehydro-3-deoxyphosphogluconate aldolase [Cohnella candidum]
MNPVTEQVLRQRIVSILRNVPDEHLVKAVGVLAGNGIRAVEVTLNTPGALEQIARLRKEYGNEMLIGAGTVITGEDAEAAIRAGAAFLITPCVTEEAATVAREAGIPVYMGAMTPSEIVRASRLGADIVKVFPCGSLGPGYLKEVLAPLNGTPLMAVGGVAPENVGEYLRAGAVCAGVGGSLVSARDFTLDGWELLLADRSRRYVEAIAKVL